jgi:hypothetical protein
LLRSIKPSSSRRTRLLLASLVWSAVGVGLLVAGLRWLLTAPGSWAWLGLVVALLVGAAKGFWVLARRAADNARRIAAAGEARCPGGAFSWGSWLLAVGMMGAGFGLRHSPLPRPWLGLIYTVVGVALLGASGVSWSHWRALRPFSRGGSGTQPSGPAAGSDPT